jgi:MFS transporter, ACS family, D-galactonate transporter
MKPFEPASRDQRPSWVRWRIVALLMALSFLSWFNRLSMPAAYDEQIKNEFAISPEAIGWVYSSLLLVYAVFMTPGGWFIDRFGAKTALLGMGFGSALFVALTGFVGLTFTSTALLFVALLSVRSLLGLFMAPIYPASARMVGHWLPSARRAWGNGLINGSACLGMACAYVGFGRLMDWVHWQWAFVIAGIVTALLALVWALMATDYPKQHPAVNAAEHALLDAGSGAQPAEDRGEEGGTTLAWRILLRNRSLVCLTLSYAAVGYFEYLFNFWMHYYFEDVLHLGAARSRYYAGILFLAQAAGMAGGGWLADRAQSRYGLRLGRALVPIGGMLGSAGFLILGLLAAEPGWIVLWFALAMAAIGACEGPFWTTAIELGGARGGTAAGICNTGGNAGGLLAPIVTPWVSGIWGWAAGISLGSLVCVVGVCLWGWIDPAERPALAEHAGKASRGA